jgi:hypothetical protein
VFITVQISAFSARISITLKFNQPGTACLTYNALFLAGHWQTVNTPVAEYSPPAGRL